MKNRTLGYFTIAIMCLASFYAGLLVPDLRTEKQMLTTLTDDELQDRIDTDRLCMVTGSIAGCRMTHEQLGSYHATKREIERRANAETTQIATD